jgi:exodeoxyribonuclease VII small subunit
MAREKTPKPSAQQAEADFEHSMTELERIVEELESGALPLDASLAHYEKGMALAKRLTASLNEAEKRIEKLVEAESAEAEEEPTTEPAKLELRPPAKGSPEGELPF